MNILLRQRKTKNPCSRCGLNPKVCICEFIPKLILKTRILLVVHAKELKRTTNTGKLTLEALPNSIMKIRGIKNEALDLSDQLTSDYQSLLYYPADGAEDLNQNFMKSLTRPVQLIVPDGNWRQASKVHIRHKELRGLPRVMIKEKNTARYHLRAESTSYGMSTLEAIAKALGVIEGLEVEAALMQMYRAKLQNTLKGRGIIFD